MHIIKLPKSKVKVSQVVVLEWFKSNGSVSKGDVLCLVQAGQDLIELESCVSGDIVKVLAPAGTVIAADEAIVAIGDAKEDISILDKALAKPQETPVDKTVEAASEENDNKVDTKLAEEAPAEQKGADVTDNKEQKASVNGQVVPILMPQAGQSMEEGTIVSWKVAEGDVIAEGQVIFEIETDKAVMEVEAIDAGRIAKIVAGEGAIVEVKLPVAYLADEGVDVEAWIVANGGEGASGSTGQAQTTSASTAPTSTFTAQKNAAAISDTGRVKASPAARKAAAEKGIDLAAVSSGSGPGGRILSFDLDNVEATSGEARVIPISKMRRAIAKNLQYSKQNVPHFYIKATIDASKLFSTYRTTKAEQFKCSLNDFVVMACAKAVKKYPEFRSQYKETEILEIPTANIGIAVGTDNGLTVPVVVAADRMTLKQLAGRTSEVVESARGWQVGRCRPGSIYNY